MKRMCLMVAIALGALACRGPEGKDGEDGVVGPPPEIVAISPGSGSAGTIFTIRGHYFGTQPEVLFGGFPAEILSLSAKKGEIRVTSAFEPVHALETKMVVVEARNQTSNPIPVWAFPSGSWRELDYSRRVFGETDAMARAGDVIWIVDRTRGLFRVHVPTGAITPAFLNYENGFEKAQNVFTDPAGNTYVAEEKSGSDGTLYVLHRIDAAGELEPIWYSFWSCSALAGDGGGTIYFANGDAVRRRLPDGSIDPAWDVWAGGTPGGMAYLEPYLYVTLPSLSKIRRIDVGAQTISDFVSIPAVRALITDGTDFYAAGSSFYHVGIGGEIGLLTTPHGVSMPDASLALAPEGGFVLTSPGTSFVVGVDASGGNTTLVAGGLTAASHVARDGAGMLALDPFPLYGGAFSQGSVLWFGDDGTVTSVMRGPYPLFGLARWNDGFAVTSRGQSLVHHVAASTMKVTTLLTPAEVLNPGNLVVHDGDLYIISTSLITGTASIDKLTSAGAWTPDWAVSGPDVDWVYGLTISRDRFWIAGNQGGGDGALYTVPLSGGEWTRVTPPSFPIALGILGDEFIGDVLAPDGRGGVYLVQYGDILQVSADGDIRWRTAFAGDFSAVALEEFPETADIYLGNGLAFGNPDLEPMGAMMP